MTALRGLAWLLALQSAGEAAVARPAPALSRPGGGHDAAAASRCAAPAVREPVAACADFLLSHLSLLFVPVGVGVMTHLGLVSQYGGRMLLVIVLSTWIGLAVTALVLRAAVAAGFHRRKAMPKFVELWVYLSSTPLFGLTATLVVYVLAQALSTRGCSRRRGPTRCCGACW